MPTAVFDQARGSSTGTFRQWLVPLSCLLIVGTLLGVSTNLAKVAASSGLHPLTFLTWSVVGATVLLTTTNAATGRLPRPGKRLFEYSLVSALVGVAGPNLILYNAVPKVGAGFVALSIAFPPLLTYLGALALRLEVFNTSRAIGVGLALTGAAYMAFLKFSLPDAPAAWIAATLLAPVLLAAGNIYRTVRWPSDAKPDEVVPGVLIAASILLVAASVLTDTPLGVSTDNPVAVFLILTQTMAFSVQYVLFFVLQKSGGPVYLSLLGSVAAVTGVPVAVLLLGEMPPDGLAAGSVLIALGTFLVIHKRAKQRQERLVERPAATPSTSLS
jgi:drug/metabolite transporter (DMT)-like permease